MVQVFFQEREKRNKRMVAWNKIPICVEIKHENCKPHQRTLHISELDSGSMRKQRTRFGGHRVVMGAEEWELCAWETVLMETVCMINIVCGNSMHENCVYGISVHDVHCVWEQCAWGTLCVGTVCMRNIGCGNSVHEEHCLWEQCAWGTLCVGTVCMRNPVACGFEFSQR